MKKEIGILAFLFVLWLSPLASQEEVTYPEHVYCVILAGGSGERLWPLSRMALPKQLLKVGQERNLVDQAIDRILSLVPKKNTWISTTQQHSWRISQAVGYRTGNIVAEPGSRNTGPAILYCCFELYQHDPNAIVAFLPADAYIPPDSPFPLFLEEAFDYVIQRDRIVLLGLKPQYPATGFGYIEYDQKDKDPSHSFFPVKKFHEKPSFEAASQYVAAGNMLWNVGMFCGRVAVFLEEFKRHAPLMYSGVLSYVQKMGRYEDVATDSIDYAIMEKSSRVDVLPVDFSWCDIGNLEVFLTLKGQTQHTQENVLTVDASSNLVDVPGKLVALIGVHGLCIVDTGDVLMIVPRNEAEKVKKIVKILKEKQAQKYL